MPAGYGKAPQHIEAEVSVYDALGLEEKMALRAVALKRAKEMGGRPLVSGILVDLVRQHQGELEDEAGRYLELLDLL